MKNSINNLKNNFTCTEVLSTEQCFAVKGGGGEDIRKSLAAAKPAIDAFLAKAVATLSTYIAKG